MQRLVDNEKRVVMTLDAGGTNFIFSAIKGNRSVVMPIRSEPNSNDLEKCLDNIIKGFEQVMDSLAETPEAISFAFPGPADYPNGIIGDLPNLPAFLGGVPLGPMLEDYFAMPVFINNDGNLFAYGEALCGFLPELNQNLEESNNSKRYRNLIGVTLGTGFGVGLVNDNHLIMGDNSNGGEGWLMRDLLNKNSYVEDHLSREGIRRNYAFKSGAQLESVGTPENIYQIAKGVVPGNKKAAFETFEEFGTVLGEALANLIALFDGIVVLGGGISKAFDLFSPAMFKQLRSKYKLPNGKTASRLAQKVYDLEDGTQRTGFLTGDMREITIPNTRKRITYDPVFKTGVGVSKHDTGQMIALGAYSFALCELDKKRKFNN